MTIYHKHHIIPRHMGGTDDPDNLVEVTVDQHALLHKQLWEDLGQWEDYVAWKAISGTIDKQEIITLKNKLMIKERNGFHGKSNPFYGKKHKPETLKINREKHLGLTYNRGRKHTEKARKNMGKAMLGKDPPNKGISYELTTCPNCAKVGGSNAMKRYHFDNCRMISK